MSKTNTVMSIEEMKRGKDIPKILLHDNLQVAPSLDVEGV